MFFGTILESILGTIGGQWFVKLPVSWNCHKCENWCTHWYNWNETTQFAVDISKWPMSIQHVDVIESHI